MFGVKGSSVKSALLLGDEATQMLKGQSAEVILEKRFNLQVNNVFSLTFFATIL